MKLAYGVDAGSLSPSDLIQAMLKAQVDLLYFGGIGTYVKASGETHEDVGDRANEALRINGRELRAKVIGEGANLGMTQRGRIEAAQSGVHLNTDAIDNSGGVDTSDHEVNIKILLRKAIDQKTLTFPTRDKLLASMTNEVGFLVLRDNYLQTQALTLAETQAVEFLPVHVRCMQIMEKTGLLNRAVEFLPDDADVAERHRSGKGLTRPELAVLLSYSKIWLYQKILDSDLPDDPALQSDLTDYFPKALRKVYAKDIAQHQLRREIAATVLTNDIVNHAGIDIILTMNERADPESVARAYLLAREVFALPEIWADIEALDNKVPAAVQTRLLITVGDALLEAMDRILADKNALMHLAPAIEANRNGLDQLGEWVARHAALLDESIHQAESDLTSKGVPAALSRRVSHFPVLVSAFDLIGFANKNKGRISDLASIFFALEKRLDIGWLSKGVVPLASQTSWQREAVGAALEDLASHHRRLTAQLANKKAKSKTESKTNGAQDVATWATHQAAKLERYDALLAEGRAAGVVDLAMLLLANARLNAVSA